MQGNRIQNFVWHLFNFKKILILVLKSWSFLWIYRHFRNWYLDYNICNKVVLFCIIYSSHWWERVYFENLETRLQTVCISLLLPFAQQRLCKLRIPANKIFATSTNMIYNIKLYRGITRLRLLFYGMQTMFLWLMIVLFPYKLKYSNWRYFILSTAH